MEHGRLLERHTIDYIPLAERRGKVWHLWPVWFSGDAHLATLAVGVIGLTLGANLLWTTIAVVSGCALGTVFMAFHSTQGPQLGLPQLIQSRPQFGYLGALLVWIVALVAYIGYNAFNAVLVTDAAHTLIGRNIENHRAVVIGFGLLAAVLPMVGYHWIHRVQRWVAYLTIAMLLIFTLGGATRLHLPADAWTLGAFPAIPFLVQFFAAAAYQLSWSIYVSDYSRYLPPDVGVASSFFWTSIGAFIGGIWMMLVGTVAAALSPTAEISAALQTAGDTVFPGFGTALLGVAILGLITMTGINFYGAALTLLSIADCFRKTRPGAIDRIVALAVEVTLATGIALASSAEKRELAERLGADASADSRAEPEAMTAALLEANGGEPVDVVLQMSGGSTFDAQMDALAPFGRMIAFGIASREPNEVRTSRLMRTSRAVVGFWIPHLLARPDLLDEGISELLGAVASGELEVVIGGVHPMSDVARLQTEMAERRTHGKLLLDPST